METANLNNFETLRQLVLQMTTGEVSTAKKFLVAFDSNVTRNKNKGLKLFKLLLDKPEITQDRAKRHVNKEMDDRSFERLAVRLKAKLLESLLLDINIQRKDAYSDWYRNKLDINKKFLEAFTIMGRGLEKDTFALYEKAIAKAKEYELYDELYEVLSWYRSSKGIRLGKKEFDKYIPDLEFCNKCRTALYKAREYYYRHFIEDVDFKGQNSDKVALLTEAISYLQEAFIDTDSANVGYYLYFLEMEYYLIQEAYEDTCETGLKLVDLIKNRKAIYMPKRLGFAYSDLADSELFANKFEEAIEHAQLAQNTSITNDFNYKVYQETEFKANFYLNRLNEAETIVDDLIAQTDPELVPFHYSKRNYFKACLYFLKGQYKECYHQLMDVKDIEEDKEGWNVGIRILKIMCMVERNKFDVADSEIESLRKYVERFKSIDMIRQRDGIIQKCLSYLEKHSFDFKKTMEAQPALFEQLNATEKELRWEVKTPEMIVFHQWFTAKANKQPYCFVAPPLPKPQQLPQEKELVPVEVTVNKGK